MEGIKIIEATLDLTLHAQAVLDLTNAYAADPMGNGSPLSAQAAKNLIPGLSKHPTTIIFLAFQKNKALGIATCFKEFSTFNAQTMLYLSDFFVLPEYQGAQIGKMLLDAVTKKAVELKSCRVVLEVQENNKRAIQVYQKAGFQRQVPVEAAGGALLFSKQIETET